MKRLITVIIVVLVIGFIYNNNKIENNYTELYRAIDTQVDRCAVDMLNGVECD